MKILHVDSGNEWRGGQQQTIYHLRYLKQNSIACGLVAYNHSPLLKAAQTLGFELFAWQLQRELHFPSVRRLKEILNRFDPDIVIINDSRSILSVILANHRIKKILVAIRRVDFPVNPISAKFKYNKLNHIITVSSQIKKILANKGIPPDKISVIPDGIDLNRFTSSRHKTQVLKEWDIPADCFHIGNVGSLVDHKGQVYLIEAAAILLKKYPRLFFSIAGDGELKQVLSEKIKSLNISHRFKLLGFIDNIPAYLKSLDLYIQPSKLEGMGSAVVEAMASGVPVIGSDGGAIKEVVEGYGLLFKSQNPIDLVNQIETLYTSENEREKYVSLSKKRAPSFDYNRTNRQLWEVCSKLWEFSSKQVEPV